MNFPCPTRTDCVCDPNPITNFSSELPDQFEFVSQRWNFPPWTIGDPGPGTGHQPPGYCASPRSQLEADLCAGRTSYTSGPPPGGAPNGFPTTPRFLFYSTEQTCSHTCPDGSVYVFKVAAGAFVSNNQTLSDQMAQSLACRLANNAHVCMQAPLGYICSQAPYSSSITAPLAVEPVTYSITSGSLPPGLLDSSDGKSLLIAGTPTTPGNYIFTVMAVDAVGNTMIGTYTIKVYGLTSASPPNGSVGSAYSFLLTVGGGTSPDSFTLVAGTLPTGLSLASNGLISGTPTVAESTNFTVRIADSSNPSIVCNTDLTMTVDNANCPDWTTLVWTAPTVVSPPLNPTLTYSFSGAGYQIDETNDGNPLNGFFLDGGNGSLLYTGPGCNCKVTITFSATGFFAATLRLRQDGTTLATWNEAAGSTVIPFTLIAGVNSSIVIDKGNVGEWGESFNGTPGTFHLTVTFSNV